MARPKRRRPKQAPSGPPRTLLWAAASLECPASVYFVGAGIGIVCATVLLFALGAIW